MKKILFLILSLFASNFTHGQSLDTLRGLIKDSTEHPVPGANVWAYIGNDTLYAVSDNYGKIKFVVNSLNGILIRVTYLGYEEAKEVVRPGKTSFEIVLKEKLNILKEVVIKGIINPVIVKEDTVEYEVSNFIRFPEDVIQDLLARLPGLQVNSDGSISMMGKKISKIRINGQEFMVSDINVLTSILPANLINKIQLIDDYGEQSKLTGRKTNDSQKIINLITDKKIRNIYAGRLMAAKGTEGLYALHSNEFRYTDKQSINLLLSNNNIGRNIGNTINTTAEFSFRKNINKKVILNSNLSYIYNSAHLESESTTETITSEGVLYSDYKSNGNNEIKKISPKIEVLYNPNEKDQVNFHFNENIEKNASNILTTNIQKGFQRKDQITNNESINKQNGYEGDLIFSHRFNRAQRVLLVQLNIKDRYTKGNLQTDNNLRFYSNDTSIYSDSVLNQIIVSNIHTNDYKAELSYVEPIANNGSLEFNYSYFKSFLKNDQTTKWMNEDGKFFPVDSLKNNYGFYTNQHQVELNFQHKKGTFNYLLGGNIRPYILVGGSCVSGMPIFPVFQFGYNKTNKTSLKFKYNGESIFPTFRQLSLTPDYSDIQNPIYGNPNLKISQKHSLSFDFFNVNKGNTFFIKLSGTVIHNNIVSNIFLVEDVLGTVKQETHFINSNGNILIENSNLWTKQLKDNLGYFDIQLGGVFTQNALYFNNIKKLTQNLKLSSKFGINYNPSFLNLTINALYTFSENNYSIEKKSIIAHVININSYNIVSFNKNLKCEVILSKQLNFGFGSALNNNPLLLDIRINKWWLKKKITTVMECNNILNESSQITQSMANNVISASTFSNRGRYFILKCIFDIKSIKI